MPSYIDTSAFVKLVRSEPESAALRDSIRSRGPELVSSSLLALEARRAARRYGPLAENRTEAGLEGITLVPIDGAIIDRAAELEPPHLRSLDAIHLATLLSLAGDVSDFYCYDGRLASAAEAAGANVLMPGPQR